MTSLYSKAWVLIAYALTASFLSLGMLVGGRFWYAAGLILFLIWDIGWLTADKSVRDRSAKETLDSSTRARTYMSWFLGVYGAVLAIFLFRSTDADRSNFFNLCIAANIDPIIFVLPFALTGLVLLFFPVALGEGDSSSDLDQRKPSTANISVLMLNAWAQKVTTYSFLYAVLRLLYYSWAKTT